MSQAQSTTMGSRLHALLLRLSPSDVAVLALLAIAVSAAAVRLPEAPNLLGGLLVLHLVLLTVFALSAWTWARWEKIRWVQWTRPLVTVLVVFEMYASLGRLGVVAMPYLADSFLSGVDTWIFGVNPTFAIQPYLTPGRVAFFSFVYAAFIPYINLTIALNCLGRPVLERNQFLTGWVFTYGISYLGYIFIPARGPVFFHAAEYHVALQDGFFYALVQRGMEASGGYQGVFPSLHVGGSLYLCLFELRTNRLRGLIYLPLVLLIYLATVVLRYHYVIDLIAGTIVAV